MGSEYGMTAQGNIVLYSLLTSYQLTVRGRKPNLNLDLLQKV